MKWLYEKYESKVISNALRLMDEIPWEKSQHFSRKVCWGDKSKDSQSGWDRIPAITEFDIKLGPNHPLLKLEGIERRTPNKLTVTTLTSKSGHRYMKYQITRLESIRHNPGEYWKRVEFLMKHSKVFRTSAINHVFHNWYKSYSLWFILNVNRKASTIIDKGLTNLDFKRVYIEKSTPGQWRPLGVPKPEWRLVLHMLNNFISSFTIKYYHLSMDSYLVGVV